MMNPEPKYTFPTSIYLDPTLMTTKIEEIPISILPIRLGQFLKLAEMAQDGLEAKLRIQNREVRINGGIETRRGKQLSDGDLISLGRKTCMVCLTEKAAVK